MSETLLLNLLCVPGVVVLGIGIWLFRSGKTIEQKIPVADADSWLKPTPQVDRTSLLFYNFQAHFKIWFLELWKANSTKPLAYICIVSGLVLIFLSLVSILNFSIVITQEQFIWVDPDPEILTLGRN